MEVDHTFCRGRNTKKYEASNAAFLRSPTEGRIAQERRRPLVVARKQIKNKSRIFEQIVLKMQNQLITEINQIIVKLSESQLKPLLEYLKQVEKSTEEQTETANLIHKIFEEDSELLKRLAQ